MKKVLPLKVPLLLVLLLLVSGSGWAATSVSRTAYWFTGCGILQSNSETLTCTIAASTLTCSYLSKPLGSTCYNRGPITASISAGTSLTHVFFPMSPSSSIFDGNYFFYVCANDNLCWRGTMLPQGESPSEYATGISFAVSNIFSTDIDGDGVINSADNCPSTSNSTQANFDGDAQGNVCDTDDDNDGVEDTSDKFPLNIAASSDSDNDGYPGSWRPSCDATCQANSGLSLDNCPSNTNADQLNADGDAQGNVCDADDDNDGLIDIGDAYPFDPLQAGDIDGDGVDGFIDNCPSVVNTDQLNTDGDVQGNVCDSDDDNDGVADGTDKFPLDPTESVDTDNDGIGNNADTDDDNDTVLDGSDNCPSVVNTDQLNTDGDVQGNVCDSDDDNDGVADGTDKFPLNAAASSDSDNDGYPDSWRPSCDATCQANSGLTLDNCPSTSNPTQVDFDGDGQGDACDADDDNDGLIDTGDAYPFDPLQAGDIDGDGIDGFIDNCSSISNADQLNTDGDAQGNACDTDDDNDGIADTSDKFPLNPAASSDSDNDGYPGSWRPSCDAMCQANSGLTLDNCPSSSNPTQANFDGDSQGDACDTDDDNDGVPDTSDAFDFDPAESVDTDGDGLGNNADWDDDNDGVPDNIDAASLNSGNTSEIVLPLDGSYKGGRLQVEKQAQ